MIFEDAPEDEKERSEVMNRMLQIQYDLIKEVTGDDKPYVRVTFYDEIATLLAKGYVKPPEGENMIWTFVSINTGVLFRKKQASLCPLRLRGEPDCHTQLHTPLPDRS